MAEQPQQGQPETGVTGMEAQMAMQVQMGQPAQTEPMQAVVVQQPAVSPASPSASPALSPRGHTDIKPSKEMNAKDLYTGILQLRGVDPKEKNPKFKEKNILIAYQLDVVNGKVAYWGDLWKDFVFLLRNHHGFLSCLLVHPYHPLGKMNRFIIFAIAMIANFFIFFPFGEEREYGIWDTLYISIYLWIYNFIATWFLTAKCLVGATACKRRCFKCLACLCCGWNRCAKTILVLFLLLCIIGVFSLGWSLAGIDFLQAYLTSLLLDWVVYEPLLSFPFFYLAWRKSMKVTDHSLKPHKNHIVTVQDFLAWNSGQELPPETKSFEKFAEKYTLRSTSSFNLQ